MILYKLTRQDMTTHNGFKWELKKPSPMLPPGGELCTKSFYHAYLSPELAVLLHPIHANYQDPRLFEAEGDVAATDRDLKVGVKQLTLLAEMSLPVISSTQRVAFGILAAKEVYKEPGFGEWSDSWLDNKDRSVRFHRHVQAEAAECAAECAADAADAADAAYAAAYAAACAVAYAARAAADAGIKLDLVALAKECLKY